MVVEQQFVRGHVSVTRGPRAQAWAESYWVGHDVLGSWARTETGWRSDDLFL